MPNNICITSLSVLHFREGAAPTMGNTLDQYRAAVGSFAGDNHGKELRVIVFTNYIVRRPTEWKVPKLQR